MVRLGVNSANSRIWCTHPPPPEPAVWAADTFSRPNTKLLTSLTEVGGYTWKGAPGDDLDITVDSEVNPLSSLDLPFVELPVEVMTGDAYAEVDVKFNDIGTDHLRKLESL